MTHDKEYVTGIVDPDGNIVTLAWWSFAEMPNSQEAEAWMSFFSQNMQPKAHHHMPLEEAIRAYKAIGYHAQRFRLVAVARERLKKENDE